ncbi:heterogeneous nuclear ribonucleoprotein 1-like [Olea europaea var. sylvestris]|uniref:heterogeneous nuclear ribonucleoprotein 1-like n=1 Tax=Olea europaea var. sylvestris TaxID=158386 RepID=UPI000C1D18C4|nr:heterogeneous nuclear ribonucleoprotein 1-like [Olea europaea var. sylvestris]XP_022885118.1 heterogeneous nuclear ribonucleoprotein 1-like [Olea europaea var. sylvestris]XP_022885119.1 heterogeneous nuclear ribonucleoprotein 1-like [Olea europaea var. sylvestris]
MDYDVVAEQNVAVYGDLEGHQQYEDQYEQEEEQPYERNYGSNDNVVDSATRHDLKHDSSLLAGKLFVGGIAWETSEESFSSYFSKYGEITDSVIMMDRISGRPRGFGFITFADHEVADRVLQEEHVIDGRAVEVKRTVPREDMQVKGLSKTKKIFVGGLPLTLHEDELKEYFSSYGNIVEHQIMMDHSTGRSRGFGFVTFENEDSVERIFFNGRMHELGGKEVEIKRAEPKRFGFDRSAEGRFRGRGNSSKSVGNYDNSSEGRGGYSGKMGRGYGGGYGGYGSYGNFAGNYGGAATGFYSGYGGYGYGYGFGGPMYGGGAYGDSGYGPPPVGYGGAAGYGVGKGYNVGGYDGGRGFGNAGSSGGYGNGKSYGGGTGGYAGSKGYGNGGGPSGRFHPYRK